LPPFTPQDRDFMAETVKRMCEQGFRFCDVKEADHSTGRRGFAIFDALVFQSSTTGFLKRFSWNRHGMLTEQEQLTQDLQRREAYLAEAQRTQPGTGKFGHGVQTRDIRYWSEECYRVSEFRSTGWFAPDSKNSFSGSIPTTNPAFRELIETAIREKGEWEAELTASCIRMAPVRGHSRRRVILFLGTVGAISLNFVGTVIDVTER